jgi:hypothetical protein
MFDEILFLKNKKITDICAGSNYSFALDGIFFIILKKMEYFMDLEIMILVRFGMLMKIIFVNYLKKF